MDLAGMMLANRGFYESWRLQYLSDLTTLPDYDEGYYYGRRYWAGNAPGAPVDKDGNPVFHKLPKSWDDAKTDGERWRWALSQAAKTDRGRVNQVKHHFASFLHHQFGVQTMQRYSWYFGGRGGGPTDDTKKDTSGTYELHTLGEDETIARLATGIKRFKLPKEFNFIRIFKDVADGGNSAQPAIETLCKIFENRRQYPRAAELWKQNIDRFGAGHNNYRKKCLDQIVKNWGIFEPVMTQPGGKGATVEYRFRNGRKVSLTAHEIKISKLLDDVKAYIKTKPAKFDWGRANIGNIGYRLVTKNEKQYMGRQVSSGTSTSSPSTSTSTGGSPLPPPCRRPAPTCSPRRWPAATPAGSSSGSPTPPSSRSSSTRRFTTSLPTRSPASRWQRLTWSSSATSARGSAAQTRASAPTSTTYSTSPSSPTPTASAYPTRPSTRTDTAG